MLKITWWKVLLDWVNITERPIYNYIWISRNGSKVLRPSCWEYRDNWNRIDTIDDWDRLYYEVRHNFELDNMFSNRREAERHLQALIDIDDYYNWNEKQDEFYFDD